MVDALALEDDEGRDERRYASGSSKYAEIRGFPNGETRVRKTHAPCNEFIVTGREPAELKHLSRQRKRNQTRFCE